MIPVGTNLAVYYYDNEMLQLPEKGEWTPPAIGCGPGKWYRGTVVAEHITPQNVLMYKCTFDTPLQHAHSPVHSDLRPKNHAEFFGFASDGGLGFFFPATRS